MAAPVLRGPRRAVPDEGGGDLRRRRDHRVAARRAASTTPPCPSDSRSAGRGCRFRSPTPGRRSCLTRRSFDSMDVLAALTQQVRAHGGVVVEGRRVVSVSRTGEPTLTLQDGSQVRGQTVVLATGIPVLDRGLYFAKVEPLRSYALAFDHPQPSRADAAGSRLPFPGGSGQAHRAGTAATSCSSAERGTPSGVSVPSPSATTGCGPGPTSSTRGPWRRTPGRPRTTPRTTASRSSDASREGAATSTSPPGLRQVGHDQRRRGGSRPRRPDPG